jgi:hypothetical protein
MKMLKKVEIDGTNITLQAAHSGYPWWLIVSRGARKDAEIWSKIFDNQFEAERVYDFLALRFAHDHLKRIIGDDERYARILKRLEELEDDPFFRLAVRNKNEHLIESLLGWILEQSEVSQAVV